jgi:hypothetical protein
VPTPTITIAIPIPPCPLWEQRDGLVAAGTLKYDVGHFLPQYGLFNAPRGVKKNINRITGCASPYRYRSPPSLPSPGAAGWPCSRDVKTNIYRIT